MVDDSRTGLEREETAGAKVRSTIVLLLMALPLALLTYTVDRFTDGAVRSGLLIVMEILWVFWVLALVAVWWRPQWVWRMYLSAERKALVVAYAATFFVIGTFFIAIVIACYIALAE